jgi:hypothetical protein
MGIVARRVIWLGFPAPIAAGAIALAQALPAAGFWMGRRLSTYPGQAPPSWLLRSCLSLGEFANSTCWRA